MLTDPNNPPRWNATVGLDGAGLIARQQLPATLAKSLPSDEVVLMVLRPSPWFLLVGRLDALVSIGVVVGIGALIGWLQVLEVRSGAVLAYGVIALSLLIIWNCLDFATRAYVLTDRRSLRVSGVIRRATYDIPLNRIQSVALHQGIRERIVGAGTVLISSAAAGGAGAGAGEFTWYFIDRPERASALVREAIERYTRP
jgi:uncharacterized membrane protein YdbT with pleckstrin-like domain